MSCYSPTYYSPENADVAKAIESYQRRQEYNKKYYETVTKPKQQQLKETSQLGSAYIQRIQELEAENASLRSALNDSRTKLIELTVASTFNILPSLNGLKL